MLSHRLVVKGKWLRTSLEMTVPAIHSVSYPVDLSIWSEVNCGMLDELTAVPDQFACVVTRCLVNEYYHTENDRCGEHQQTSHQHEPLNRLHSSIGTCSLARG